MKNTTGLPNVYTVEDVAPQVWEAYDKGETRHAANMQALLSRIAQAKTAIERVLDRLDGTFEPALSHALDRLVELREQVEK